MIYDNYYSNVSNGTINPENINFSAYIVDDTYQFDSSHTKSDVTGRIETLVKVLIKGDIASMTMSEIIEKIKSKLEPNELEKAKGFVVYDIASTDLCFFENLE